MNSRKGSGDCQPPRKSVTPMPLSAHMPKYSAMKKRAYLKPEYSVRCPAISSLSASGKSNGERFDSALAESNRSPFDLPEAESELIAGHLTEYSGFKYALFFMAEYFGMCALSGMGVTLFLGGWQSPLPFLEFIPSYIWFAAKLLTLLLRFIWIRATLPRLRIDQLTRLAWKFLVPLALINLGTAAFWSMSGDWTGARQLVRWIIALTLVVGPFVVMGRKLSAGVAPRTYRYAT